jgi:RNA polymerase-binding protein DksA
MKTMRRGQMTSERYEELRRMLEERRREITQEVQGKIRDARAEHTGDVVDAVETSEADIQEDIEFALIQMKAETLNKIDAALRRLDEGAYGVCTDCGGPVGVERLRAEPQAARCIDCQRRHEKTYRA